MKILLLPGSSRPQASNVFLLKAIMKNDKNNDYLLYDKLHQLPVFRDGIADQAVPIEVMELRKAIEQANAIIISTPEYIFNMPAQLKNAFEWVTSSGEMYQKKVLPIVYTPHSPRGKRCMQSMIWSLQALKSEIVTSLELYQDEFPITEELTFQEGDDLLLLKEAISLLSSN